MVKDVEGRARPGSWRACRCRPCRRRARRAPTVLPGRSMFRSNPHPPPAAGPVRPTAGARTALRPAGTAAITGGFWHRRRAVNAEVCIPQGPVLLEAAGNLHDLQLAAGGVAGEYRGDYPFMDSDVHKWLEAAAWQLARTDDPRLAAEVGRIVGLVAAAQEPDGYLNTWFQVTQGG